ncbi:flavin monoamine oxidase family protein [Sphingomonas aerophila]|uniref:Monoamine oxidase n=1 Tax=Sphingomonas aerophila TaxID=1344948 RepID=A0A7W9BGQ6_9SPHN|nr:FAD-dependent oxidoreductase [Sphingomonas aerophila]MBB5716624.1 monoamine oxidase [Sphingomonas aerophila]
MQRRTLLKTIAGLGASLVAATGAGAQTLPPRAGRRSVIVAGAGITGLCCAYELMQHGIDVTVLEASGRYGGHVYTGRDGLSDGMYADYGADHITRPGYEQFMRYVDAFKLPLIAYPGAEGSPLPANNGRLRMIGGKFHTEAMLADPAVLAALGCNPREVAFLAENPWHELPSLFLADHISRFRDPSQPFGNGMDDLDTIDLDTLYARQGASQFTRKYLGGEHVNALYSVWRFAVMKARGIPLSEGKTFHLAGGNEAMPKAFAARLGARLKLNHPITAIDHDTNGVTVSYTAYGSDTPETMRADYLVNCISLPVFRRIVVTPSLSPAKQYVVDNLSFSSHPFFVFEAETKFWLDDGLANLSMEFEHPDIQSIWVLPETVGSTRVLLKAFGPGGVSPQRVLAAFREVYPGKKDTIVQALTFDWTKDTLAPTCEMEALPVGELHRFWPEIMKPNGRLYFAGTYADPLSRGMESCVRSAARVAQEIVAT